MRPLTAMPDLTPVRLQTKNSSKSVGELVQAANRKDQRLNLIVTTPHDEVYLSPSLANLAHASISHAEHSEQGQIKLAAQRLLTYSSGRNHTAGSAVLSKRVKTSGTLALMNVKFSPQDEPTKAKIMTLLCIADSITRQVHKSTAYIEVEPHTAFKIVQEPQGIRLMKCTTKQIAAPSKPREEPKAPVVPELPATPPRSPSVHSLDSLDSYIVVSERSIHSFTSSPFGSHSSLNTIQAN